MGEKLLVAEKRVMANRALYLVMKASHGVTIAELSMRNWVSHFESVVDIILHLWATLMQWTPR